MFERIYRDRRWGNAESVSGPGSGLARTANLRAALGALIGELGIETVLDAGCGDFHWMAAADLPVREYVGVDVVPDLVEDVKRRYAGDGRVFRYADITREPLPRSDLILCRDCLIHFPDADVKLALENFARSGSRWLLATTFTKRPINEAITLGDWRTLNLEAPPFDLPRPERYLEDIPLADPLAYRDKRLALWDLRLGVVVSGLKESPQSAAQTMPS